MNDSWLNFVWPLAFILVMLVALRQLRDDAGPIFKGIVSGLGASASKNAAQYAIALAFGLSASLSAFWEVFHNMDTEAFQTLSWHQYLAQWSKVLNPFVVAILAYATQSGPKPTANTNPPFPPTPPTP